MGPSASSQLINFCLFSMGVATLLQTTIGNRLPIIQGPSATLTGTLAPIAAQLGPAAMWGGAFAGALMEAAAGASGILKRLGRFIPPAVSGTVVAAIGISLGQVAIRFSAGQGRWRDPALAGAAVLLILVLQFGFRRLRLLSQGAIFISIWTIGLGVGGLLGEVNWALVRDSSWLQLPRFFPFGAPGWGWELPFAAAVAAAAGYLASMAESVGDYAAVCEVSDEPLKPRHISRGILAEGLGCLGACCFGGLPCTSYSQNVGVIAATRVASRRVVQVAACILILYGLCPKFGALLTAMPRSVVGGVFLLVCALIVHSGIRLIGKAEPTLSNSLTIGLTLVCALGLPTFLRTDAGALWMDVLPEPLRLLSTNSAALAVLFGIGLNLLLGRPLARKENP